MTLAAIAANVHETLDVLSNLPTKVALDDELTLDHLAQAIDLLLGQ